jgi:hypothetical protein
VPASILASEIERVEQEDRAGLKGRARARTLDRPMPSDLEHLLSFIAKTCVALAKVDQARGAGPCFGVVIYLNPSSQT